MEVGGWVQVSLGIFLVENHPKIALNQYSYFGVVCILSVYEQFSKGRHFLYTILN